MPADVTSLNTNPLIIPSVPNRRHSSTPSAATCPMIANSNLLHGAGMFVGALCALAGVLTIALPGKMVNQLIKAKSFAL